ncbi:potassium channel family protein [Haloglomus halophilum]|uniref:potassium channel family protein n=1 Tax=Haloglomus halophilum TaxID=2962672 RepID=UPI0020C9C05E|nr:TrkA family potassium uptake protein [Haloglomus halophilum]
MNGDLRVVVVGSGRVGLRVTRLLDARGHDVVMVERNPDRVERVLDAYVATVIEGDATHPSVLEQVDLDRADVVATMTDTMGTNLSVALLTRRLAPDVRTVMRVVDGNIEEYEDYADALVFPERAGATAAINAVLGGDVRTVENLPGELEIIEMTVTEGAPVAGKTLQEVSLPRGSLVVSGAAGHAVAASDTRLEPGHGYLVAVENQVADEVTRLFRG